MSTTRAPSLFSAVALGVGSVVGSGWLFACYFAAKDAGPGAIASWIVCAILNIFLAALLAEVAIMHPEKSLFSRLLSISHNQYMGFAIALANWLTMIMLVPSEAAATVQYASTLYPNLTHYLYSHNTLTGLGMLTTDILIVLYGVINYKGIGLLTKTNNLITTIKLIVPIGTALVILFAAFHPGNFTLYRDSFVPYGADRVFTTIITSGMFYTFSCFYLVTVFAVELDNPRKNLPRALFLSVIFCLVMYILLQIAFVGAVNPASVAQGWHKLNFTSPLAELSVLLGLNWLAVVLYADATISPSGAGIIYTAVATRMLNGMADDHQAPKVFAKLNPKYNISVKSLMFSLLLCMILVFFFDSWQKIMMASSVFILLGALAIPIAFVRIRKDDLRERSFRVPLGKTISLFCFLLISYLLVAGGTDALLVALIFEVAFFAFYIYNGKSLGHGSASVAIKSSWSIFIYLLSLLLLAHLKPIVDKHLFLLIFAGLGVITYYCLINQKSYSDR